MNAAETIQKAIDKLAAIRAENDYQIVNGWLVEDTGSGSEYIGGMRVDDGRQPVTNDPMDVTLYATIDAQLAIMESGLHERDLPDDAYDLPAYALARAIVGEEADA